MLSADAGIAVYIIKHPMNPIINITFLIYMLQSLLEFQTTLFFVAKHIFILKYLHHYFKLGGYDYYVIIKLPLRRRAVYKAKDNGKYGEKS